jgi:hypothetical protein
LSIRIVESTSVSKRSFRTLLLALGLLGANGARADTIIFQEGALLPGGGPYTGTQDTEIRGTNPTTPLGSAALMRADLEDPNGGADSKAQALLRFDDLFGPLPDQIPLTSTITSAVLTLYVTNSSTSPAGNISVYQMLSGWNESSTWDSIAGGVQIGSETVASADQTHTVLTTFTTTSFDVLASLQAWLGGDTNFGWLIENDSNDGVQFATSEETGVPSQRPMLTITTTSVPVPEPGSLMLAGLSAAAALCVRRARRSR